MKASPVRVGDYIEFFAEIDLLGALSACPGGDTSSGHSDDTAKCYPLLVQVFEPGNKEVCVKDGRKGFQQKVDVICWTAGISACASAHYWRAAVQLLEDLGSGVDVVAWSAVMSACDKGGEWQMTLALLRAMQDSKLDGDTVAYNAAISACGRNAEALWAAEALYCEMMQLKGEPSLVTYGTVITAREKGSQWQKALELFVHLDQTSPENLGNVIQGAAVSACARGEQWEFALEIATSKANLIVCNAGIHACAKAGQWTIALGLLEWLTCQDCECDFLGSPTYRPEGRSTAQVEKEEKEEEPEPENQ
eukprot:symbB.v1.2.020028.t1/scaffold1663.1/size106897/8